MAEMSYSLRVLILIGICCVLLSLDLWKPPGQRHRWKEYLFLAIASCLVGLFGIGVDSMTSRISPEYFLLGKGLESVGWKDVAVLGWKAGFGMGFAGGAVLLYFSKAPERTLQLCRFLWLPLLLAAVLGTISGSLSAAFPHPHHPVIDDVLASPQASRFTTVWLIHCGIYLGGFLGLVWAILLMKKRQASLQTTV